MSPTVDDAKNQADMSSASCQAALADAKQAESKLDDCRAARNQLESDLSGCRAALQQSDRDKQAETQPNEQLQ